MNKIFLSIIIQRAALSFVLAAGIFAANSCESSADESIAKVGSYEVSVEEFETRYTDYIVTSGVEDDLRTRKAILNNIINEILLKRYDENEAVYENEEYQKEKEWIFKQNLLGFLKDREIYRGIEVSDKEVRDAFVKMNQTLTARHLYAKDKEEAEQLYQLLQTGSTFDELAQQVFTDSTLRNSGGFIGSFTWGDMDPAFEEAAYSLDVNEISEPVKTRTGYSIIKLEEKEYNPLLTEYQFQQKKPQIETTLKIRKKNPTQSDYIDSIFDKSKLKIRESGIQSVFTYLKNGSSSQENKNKIENETALIYKDKSYEVKDIINRINGLPEYQRTKINTLKNVKTAAEGFVIQDILIEEAEDKAYDENEIMLKNYETMLNNLFLKYKAKDAAAKVKLEDSTLHKYYEAHLDFFSTYDEINIQEIIVDDKKLVGEIMQKLRAGEDFGELASKNSIREWSAKNKGIIGFTPITKFGILKTILWNAEVGELVGPKEINGIYGVFKILGKKKSKPLKYENIKDEVLKVYRNDRQNELLFEYISELRNNVDIEVNEKLLSSLKFNLNN